MKVTTIINILWIIVSDISTTIRKYQMKKQLNAFKSEKHVDFEWHMSVNKKIMPIFALN